MGSPKSKMLGSAQRVGKQLLLLRKTCHSDEHRVERRDQKRNVSNAAGGMHCELRSLARLQAALASCLYAQTDLMRCTPIFQRSQVQEPTRKGCPVAKPMSAIALLDRAGSNMLFLDLLASHGRSKSRLPACAHEACRAAKLRAKPAATAQLAWKMDGKIVGTQANQRLLLNNIKAGTTARNKLACLFI